MSWGACATASWPPSNRAPRMPAVDNAAGNSGYHQDCPVNAKGTRRISLRLRELGLTSVVFNLNARVALSHFPPVAARWGLAHAQRSLRHRATDGLPAEARLRLVRRAPGGLVSGE